MTTPQQPDVEPRETEPSGAPKAPKQRQSFGKIARELTEDEMQQSGVHKLLATELDRLDDEVLDARECRKSLEEANLKVCVLEEKRKRSKAGEVIAMATLAIGAAAIGHGLALLRADAGQADGSLRATGLAMLISGAVLTIIGIIARVIQW